ncbi:MAG: metallophosphoesterase family protein [Rhizobiales bacterium]|nr:metallophosphoesterase family protein [Hyphomicrobiales bacterium]MBO6699454.1 metallophosphoesterase family protein [Hyphomicrobiales bacterium]MBO6736992.1 metallophosphoesterase family protein [Hyphomicrobiales bacterium]MBO6911934.1 metallophosphoesterase family protein [Hyphomicrobiales bacterium]MBO6956903.1 metallophosphoesterase family protein [Hyphomicrobiales bacterium]
MRFAAVADIHGNALALEAVIEDLQREGIDQIVNLGDVLSGPIDPAGVAERIIPLGWPTVRGNHDRYLIEQDPDAMGPTDAVTHAALSPTHLDWLRTLPTSLTPFPSVYACHATPRADDTYWMERVLPDGTIRQATRDELEEQIDEHAAGANLLLCGHTHIPRIARLSSGHVLVNPGSVGCPAYTDELPVPHRMQAGTPNASYAILTQRDERWDVTFRSVPYDHDTAAAQARAYDREDWARGLESGWLT